MTSEPRASQNSRKASTAPLSNFRKVRSRSRNEEDHVTKIIGGYLNDPEVNLTNIDVCKEVTLLEEKFHLLAVSP